MGKATVGAVRISRRSVFAHKIANQFKLELEHNFGHCMGKATVAALCISGHSVFAHKIANQFKLELEHNSGHCVGNTRRYRTRTEATELASTTLGGKCEWSVSVNDAFRLFPTNKNEPTDSGLLQSMRKTD